MAYRSTAADQQQRERRQRSYVSCQAVSARFPGVKELTLELRFVEAFGKPLLSPYKQIYSGQMQAFFDLQCPSRECTDGGFDLDEAMAAAMRAPMQVSRGRLQCRGRSAGRQGEGSACPVEMLYEVTVSLTQAGI